eukprot:gb/GFBE01072858.1/.p1 GENE.gb/GFBE01072858.1/~~gb/GFBE01072858.1/.p1  ORF type:complete len:564 (+),score=103.75 gb/GFBE01072858.1/:1-1692(+)
MAVAVARSRPPRSSGYPSAETPSAVSASRGPLLEGDDCDRGSASEVSTPSSQARSSCGDATCSTTASTAGDRQESEKPPSREGLRLPAINAPRASSLGAVKKSIVTRAQLTINITPELEGIEITVELTEGELERRCEGFPTSLPKGVATTAEYRSSTSIVGELRVTGVPAIPFGVQVEGAKSAASGSKINYVSAEHRQRSVVAGAGQLELGSGMGASGEGTVVEVTVSDGFSAVMNVGIRRAKKKELTRLAQQQALVSAMEKGKYSSLLAQITRSKMRKVEASLIEQANRLLKSIQPKDGTFLTHKELAKLMKWKRVTSPAGGTEDSVELCCGSGDCACNAGQAQEGELCAVYGNTVQEALNGVCPQEVPADKWLFQALVKAAITAPEGCVWKSGGKFLLSNEERNQSPTAIVNVLERDNQESEAGKGIRALVAFTEREYGFRVTAIQLNFHPNQKSWHKQHRDIYGAGQKGGINCTCSFMKCTGTVCYSLGSSRQVLCETMTDKRSKYEPCGEECSGRKTYKWMHSGSAMYFNDPWNNNHTHGVPAAEEACGPRISVALLCA